MSFLKENAWWISIVLVIVLIISLMLAHFNIKNKQYDEWYASLTPAEKEAYELQQQQEYERNIHRYEVVSVHKYTKNITNNFGGVVRTEVCYSFTYIAGDKLCSIDDFQGKVVVGDKDLYVVNKNLHASRTLQLTKETLANIKGLN